MPDYGPQTIECGADGVTVPDGASEVLVLPWTWARWERADRLAASWAYQGPWLSF